MATYYWVGGSGNWNTTDTTNWALSSGGAGGAGVPTSTDDVVFDGSSDAGAPFVVTVTGTSSAPALCKDFTASGLAQAMTLTYAASAWLDVYGSLTLPASNFTWTGVSGNRLQFRATSAGKTITTNGVTLTSTFVAFIGVGGEWTLGSALTTTNLGISFSAGTFNSGNYNITANALQRLGDQPDAMTVNLGSSAIAVVANAPINIDVTNNLTWDAGTSTITCSNASPTFTGGGLTYYNVSFSSAANGLTRINGANTFNNLTQTSRSATGRRVVVFGANQTVAGTLTLGAANTAIRRVHVLSDQIGVQRTITLNGTLAALADVDFRDTVAAGTVATPWTGTRIGNGLNNSGITFDAPKTVYRVGTGNWSATQWSTSSGGAVNVNNFPLAQDSAIFDSNTASGTHTIDSFWWFGTLDCSALTNAVTIASGTTTPIFFGDVVLDADVTLTGTGVITLSGQGTTQSVTSAGVSFPQPITVDTPNGTVKFLDALTVANTLTLTDGTTELKEGATTTVNALQTSGTIQKTLRSGVSGVQATLSQSSGTVDVSYLTIQDINATGGATWNAFVSQGNVDDGNNTGWDFLVQLGRYIYTRRKNKVIFQS